MSAKTITRGERLRWLIDHPAVWEGYPMQFSTPGHKDHNRIVFEAMQKDGLFSPRTMPMDVNLEKIISEARHVRRLFANQPKPESN